LEEREGARVAVDEGAAADGADLAVAEEAAERRGACVTPERVGVMVEGGVDEECLFVLDFSVLKRIVRKLVDEIDHKVLLPTQNSKLGFRETDGALTVDYFGKPTYVFPRTDCALLPIPNTTAEMLAQYLGTAAHQELIKEGYTHLTLLELEVEENYGQSATYRESLVSD